jgi:hypothetical protein
MHFFTEGVPTRFVLGMMLFWGALTAFSLRSCLSLSIVTMVGKRPSMQNATSNTTFSNGCQAPSDFSNVTVSSSLMMSNTTDFFFQAENLNSTEVKNEFKMELVR